jgi:glucokinase
MAVRYRIGVDIGGTKLAAGVVDDSGRVLGECVTTDHVRLDEEGVLACAARDLRAALEEAGIGKGQVAGVGVLFPGHIRWPEGVTITSSNLPGFKGYPLRARFEEMVGLPVLADNDANGQTLGEYRFGGGKLFDPMVFMTVSTGIGGGMVFDGKLYRGATGTAGEFGHMIVDASGGQRCSCGNRGCLMGAASGLMLPQVACRVALRLAGCVIPPVGCRLLEHLDGPCRAEGCAIPQERCRDLEHLDGPCLVERCAAGNELCRAIVDEFSRYVGIGLYNIFQMLNPRMVVLGGGLFNLPGYFFEGAARTCRELAGSMMYDRMEIRKSVLGASAGVLGAAALFE